MSLLTTDISKKKRLSLKDIKLSKPQRVDPPQPINKPPTEEAIAYKKLLSINPLIGKLVDRLDLVSDKTGERIEVESTPEIKKTDREKLISLSKSLIDNQRSYTEEELIERIKQETKVTRERAEKGLELMVKSGALEVTPNNRYYLQNSTPF